MASFRQRLAEGAVRDFPAVRRDYEWYRLLLEARVFSGGCVMEERVDGGPPAAAGDRFVDLASDSVLRRLSALMLGIYEPFCALPAAERQVLALRFWQGMEADDVAAALMFSSRTVYRITARALERLYRPVSSVLPLLEDWRAGALRGSLYRCGGGFPR